eukprot:7898586-Pyramimonas_sp.AAC.1
MRSPTRPPPCREAQSGVSSIGLTQKGVQRQGGGAMELVQSICGVALHVGHAIHSGARMYCWIVAW